MSPLRRARDRRGLTLIELVLTLTILAVAGALVTGALVTALRSWQSGLRSGREELVARIVLERIAAQLRSAVASRVLQDGEDAWAFDVGDDHLRFVTLAAGDAPTQVFYGLRDDAGGRHLVYREYPWPDKDFFGAARARREEDVAEVTGLAVKVVKREEAEAADDTTGPAGTPATGGVVEEQWGPLDPSPPGRVEIEIQVSDGDGAEPRRYAISVPVLAEAQE